MYNLLNLIRVSCKSSIVVILLLIAASAGQCLEPKRASAILVDSLNFIDTLDVVSHESILFSVRTEMVDSLYSVLEQVKGDRLSKVEARLKIKNLIAGYRQMRAALISSDEINEQYETQHSHSIAILGELYAPIKLDEYQKQRMRYLQAQFAVTNLDSGSLSAIALYPVVDTVYVDSLDLNSAAVTAVTAEAVVDTVYSNSINTDNMVLSGVIRDTLADTVYMDNKNDSIYAELVIESQREIKTPHQLGFEEILTRMQLVKLWQFKNARRAYYGIGLALPLEGSFLRGFNDSTFFEGSH